jgi:hypothetical protein
MPKDSVTKLGVDTMVPISIFGVLAGGIFWLSTMYTQVVNARHEIEGIKQHISEINESRADYRSKLWHNQRSIDRRLSKIEGKIDFLVERIK